MNKYIEDNGNTAVTDKSHKFGTGKSKHEHCGAGNGLKIPGWVHIYKYTFLKNVCPARV